MTFDYQQSIWGQGTASLKWTDPTRARLKQALSALLFLPSGSRVLEIGCGAGQFIRAIKKNRPDLNCYGADISQPALDKAKTAGDGVDYRISEPYKLPFDRNYFAAVLIFDVLEHLEDPAGMLAEVRRVLTQDGIFHCFVPCEGDGLSIWHKYEAQHHRDLTKKYAGHVQRFSRRSLFELMCANGFKIFKKRYSSHWLGQMLDLFVFKSMDAMSRKQGGRQINNEAFFEQINAQTGSVFRLFKKLVNFLVNVESAKLAIFPSPNVHISARKNISVK
ncbi:MAG: hypothetical protein COU31_00470 [Candidatus Magasanikbacteria bacterium CG10_big_fil_rev_8_21_14_0_10_40_10]|uniref:Methyltransferase type 11 domain-containing protein n=1 Tax=Candidatus Magasanikbacteria bacterium CG10_big_fil_rev_8_21_14_0_10_40_10 TaxID=1974648 RepID=A0A2M6W517_9BACT|nr:MAG: hypothetical protein COU31_00470 [Candidatus Magasanikbacteria bacterium CG10_big_fil_rev_8_21_14_0_10_40_10]